MAQVTGSGPGNGKNYAMVDDSIAVDTGRLFVNSETWAGSVGPAAIDKSTNATTTLNYEHHEIHDGKHFNIRDFAIVNSGLSLVFGVTTPNGSTWTHMVFEITGTSQTEVRGWEGATLSGGVAVNIQNNNRNSANVTSLVIMGQPVISGTSPTSGTLLESHSQGLAGATPSKASFAGTSDREDEWMLKSGTTYLWELKSVDDNNIIDYAARWYEHTDKTQVF